MHFSEFSTLFASSTFVILCTLFSLHGYGTCKERADFGAEVTSLKEGDQEDRKGWGALADELPLEKYLGKWETAKELMKATKGSGKEARYPQGHLFDPKY